MICPSCNKFAAYDTSEDPDFDLEAIVNGDSIEVTGTCRVVITSECCGDELREASFNIDHVFSLKDIEASAMSLGQKDKIQPYLTDLNVIEWYAEADMADVNDLKIKGQRTLTVSVPITVQGVLGNEDVASLTFEFEDGIAFADMEELV